ncbi:hypothetical protein [Spirosoma litoris]
MKLFFTILITSLCFSQCQQKELLSPSEQTAKFVDELKPQLIGSWVIQQAQIDHKKLLSLQYPVAIIKDTLIQNLATLTFQASSQIISDKRILELEGVLNFRNVALPIYAKIYPIQNNSKLKGTMFLTYNFKGVDDRVTSAEVDYLQSIGLTGDNFHVEINQDNPLMVWRGLNRAIVYANLHKN